MASITVGMIGLGRMGLAIAQRLVQAKHRVVGFDQTSAMMDAAKTQGVETVQGLEALVQQSTVLWLMIPAGKPVDDVLAHVKPMLRPDQIIIDGGNSFFKDSMRRAEQLAPQKIAFLDCGTSGGVHGKDLGFSLMIGGDKQAYEKVVLLFEAIAAPSGYFYVGPSGSGHYVKMVHNGIEYALLQAYAEGFHMIKDGPFKNTDLEAVAHVWNHGAIIRSWIGELAEKVFARDQDLNEISGAIGENLTGQWTIEIAKELNVPVRLIAESLAVRAWSRQTGGNYATKVVAMLRHEFGGHEVKKVK